MDEIAVVEALERNRARVPKGRLFEKTVRKEVLVGFVVEVGRFEVWVFGVVGVRGGISEEVCILDTSQRIVADRLQLAEHTSILSSGHFLELADIRRSVRGGDGKDPLMAVRQHVEECLEQFKKGFYTERMIECINTPRVSTAPSFVSGGAPGGGKRR